MNVEKTVVYRINNHPIHAEEAGPADGQLALMIHGWSSSRFALSPLMPYIKERYRALAIDLPGFGESPRLPGRTTISDYVDIVASLIKTLTPERKAILIGHSMGGMISLTLTLRFPELVERMVLLCPTISGRLSLFINMFVAPITFIERFAIANQLVSTLEPYFLSITDQLMRPASFAAETGLTQADYEKLRADARRRGQGRVRAECFSAMRQNDLRGKICDIEAPALVIWGMEDNTVPLRDGSVIAREWPEADLRVIANAGHWPHFETPKVTERYIRAFLNTPLKLLNFNKSDFLESVQL